MAMVRKPIPDYSEDPPKRERMHTRRQYDKIVDIISFLYSRGFDSVSETEIREQARGNGLTEDEAVSIFDEMKWVGYLYEREGSKGRYRLA